MRKSGTRRAGHGMVHYSLIKFKWKKLWKPEAEEKEVYFNFLFTLLNFRLFLRWLGAN